MSNISKSGLIASASAVYFDNSVNAITPAMIRDLNQNWITSSVVLQEFNTYTSSADSTFAGTSSYAEVAMTASIALTASFLSGSIESSSYSAFALTASFVSTSVYSRETHVSTGVGSDITGDGTLLRPFKSIGKGLSVVGISEQLVIHPGTYAENITISGSASNITIVGANTETSGLVYISGSVTIPQTISSVRMNGITANSIHHSGSANLYLQNSRVLGSLLKTSTGFLELFKTNIEAPASISILGGGTSLFVNCLLGVPFISASTAVVSFISCPTIVQPNVIAGTVFIDGGIVYAPANGANAISSSAGTTVALKNTQLINPNLSVARVSLGGNFSLDDVNFNRSSSVLSTSMNTVAHFQNIEATNITGSLFGTSSYALTASYLSGSVDSASLAQTASYLNATASYAYTASYLSGSVDSASLAQTASYLNATASYAYTASYLSGSVESASLAQTASYLNATASYAYTASYLSGSVDTASYAFTSSYVTGSIDSLTLKGNLTVLGTASVAFLYTTVESSSIIYSSGSNQFGDNVDDTQQLFGTVIVSGSQQITGSLLAPEITGSLFGTASWANNSTTASYALTASYLSGSVETASFAFTASYLSGSVESASLAQTASYLNSTASYAYTASYISGSVETASFALTASYLSGSVETASFAFTASYLSGSVETASFAFTASYLSGSVDTASYAFTASYLNATASYAYTASYLSGSVETASFALTASYLSGSVETASFAITASYLSGSIESASYAATASFALTASYLSGSIPSFPYTGSAEITGSLTMYGSVEQKEGFYILTNLQEFEDDTAAATGGVPLYGLYRNGNFVVVRIGS